MVTQKIKVTENAGVHLRPAGRISEVCLQYKSRILIKKGDHIANAKSVLGLLAARVQQNDVVEIMCDGEDEKDALQAVINVIQRNAGHTEIRTNEGKI